MSTCKIPFLMLKNRPKLSQICSYGFISKKLKNEFETDAVNKPSVFEPLKFHCSLWLTHSLLGVCSRVGKEIGDSTERKNLVPCYKSTQRVNPHL